MEVTFLLCLPLFMTRTCISHPQPFPQAKMAMCACTSLNTLDQLAPNKFSLLGDTCVKH